MADIEQRKSVVGIEAHLHKVDGSSGNDFPDREAAVRRTARLELKRGSVGGSDGFLIEDEQRALMQRARYASSEGNFNVRQFQRTSGKRRGCCRARSVRLLILDVGDIDFDAVLVGRNGRALILRRVVSLWCRH